jgi:KipI family sensor histidine kinase inhibitor
MLGFLPGFPYLGDLPPELALPRRADPRVKVPAGSVSIATTLTAIYPYESPGGWHLIGATPVRFFDPARTPPALLAPGDAVRFDPIDATAFAAIRQMVEAGDYLPDSEPAV